VALGQKVLLVDAGRSGRYLEESMRSVGVDPGRLTAILVTHEHSDHIQSVGVLSRRYHIPVFATEGTWAIIDEKRLIGRIAVGDRRCLVPGQICGIGELGVAPFDIPHDAAQPVGYRFQSTTGQTAVVATDLGHLSRSIEAACTGAMIALIESNHDVEILRCGPYPRDLQERILGDRGHLCNESAGQLAVRMIRHGTRRIYLGHLSQENNHPAVALRTVRRILTESGVDLKRDCTLTVAERHISSEPTRM
ncbi:MAG: MBL fold metallo-hydrolase, partial [Planctomycetia bacterium]|nr:MBL fold metallo-hydrolase [Planctomycetia bacterium]